MNKQQKQNENPQTSIVIKKLRKKTESIALQSLILISDE